MLRIKLQTEKEDFPRIISRTRFPVRLCFAMTINKSQGEPLVILALVCGILYFLMVSFTLRYPEPQKFGILQYAPEARDYRQAGLQTLNIRRSWLIY